MKAARRLLDVFLKALYPDDIKCAACGSELKSRREFSLCEKCSATVKPISAFCVRCGVNLETGGGLCKTCNKEKRAFDAARAAYAYEGAAREMLITLKNGEAWVAKILSEMMLARYPYEDKKIDLVACVPVGAKRLSERGFNQSELLGREIAYARGVPFRGDALVKSRETEKQTRTGGAAARSANVKNSFALSRGGVPDPSGKTVLLIDDVLTTGSTAGECASVLKKGGASAVYVYVFAAGRGVI